MIKQMQKEREKLKRKNFTAAVAPRWFGAREEDPLVEPS